MKKLVFLTVLALFATCVASWGLVVVNETFESPYTPGGLLGQGSWQGGWVSTSVEANYEATTDPVSDGWAVFEGTGTGSVSGGILHVSDSSSTKIKWEKAITQLSNTDGTTVVFRARCTSASGTASSGYTVQIYDGTQSVVFVLWNNLIRVNNMNSANMATASNEYVASGSFDPTAYHTYTIVARAHGAPGTRVSVYVDDATTPVISGFMLADNPGGTKTVRFGCGSTGNAQEVDFDYFRVKTGGAFGPSASGAGTTIGNNLGLPIVVTSPVSSGSQASTWYNTGSGVVEKSISRTFPVAWKTGSAQLYLDAQMNATAKTNAGGNYSYMRMFDDQQPVAIESTRIYFERTNDPAQPGYTGAIKILSAATGQTAILTNPINGTWYHIKLDVNLNSSPKTYSAYFGDGDKSGAPGHWGHFVGNNTSGSLVLDDTPAVANAPFYFAGRGLASVQWLMYERSTEFDGSASVTIDNLYVEGPSRYTPVFEEPMASCGTYAQYRYFTLTPTFTWGVDPHTAYRIKVFKAPVADPELASADLMWDSNIVTSTGNSIVYGSVGTYNPLVDSDLAANPTNKYYVYGKALLDETGTWGNWGEGVDFVCNDGVPGTEAPAISAPVGNIAVVTPPTVAWTAAGPWDQYRIVLTDQTTPGTYYDSGWKEGSPASVNLASVTPALPNLTAEHTYQVQVSVRQGCVAGSAGYEAIGTSTFIPFTGPPDPIVISSPVGPYAGLKPVVEFSHRAHSALQVKITTDAAGNTIVWDSGVVSSAFDGANCPTALTPATTYYAWAKIENPFGWSPWSNYSSFTVSRSGEAIDIRHMDEAGVLDGARQQYPDDTFAGGITTGFASTGITVSNPTACPAGVIRVVDTDVGGVFRLHNSPVDFNKGTTVIAAVRAEILNGTSDNTPVEGWKSGSILITDSVMHVGASIKVRPDNVSISVDGEGFVYQNEVEPSNNFRVIRVTAKAGTYNVPASIVWKVYVDETLVATATGAIATTTLENGTGSWVSNRVAIGQGSFALQGIFDYDWLAINGSGAYAPGEWNQALLAYSPSASPRDWKLSGGVYTSLAAAMAGETAYVTVNTGPMVVNHIGDGCYYVQDATKNADSVKVKATTAAGNKGKKLNSIAGLLTSDGSIGVINPTAVNIATTSLAYSPLAMSIKALGGSPCITQLAGVSVNNVGKLVRVIGKLPVDPAYDYSPIYPLGFGAVIIYVDDLSGDGWVSDGRDGQPGLRILRELNGDPATNDFTLSTGDVVEVVGVSSTETYWNGASLVTVRKISDPVVSAKLN